MANKNSQDYLFFKDIPNFFYDVTLDPVEWEEKLIEFMKKRDSEKGFKNIKNNLGESLDIFKEMKKEEIADPIEKVKKNKDELFKEWAGEQKKTKERREDPNRINYDFKFRNFLYDKGIGIPTQEMNREFYLRERLTKEERNSLIKIVKGFSDFMVSKREGKSFALFGIGTSVFNEKYFENLKKNILNDGFDLSSKVVEKANSVLEQGEHFYTWEDYVEYCFNVSPAFDEKHRPSSKEKFNKRLKKEQERYVKEKILKDILNNKGEDLDFAICLEELYGENYVANPHRHYVEGKGFEGYVVLRDIDVLKKNFVGFLEKEGYNFKEEIEMLHGADYVKNFEGNLEKLKDIRENRGSLSTYRVFPKTGREMHFYFYNEMADMKVKQERINNQPFVQIERGVTSIVNPEFGSAVDLEVAIKNGEKTGVFENPLVLKFLKK